MNDTVNSYKPVNANSFLALNLHYLILFIMPSLKKFLYGFFYINQIIN